MEKLKCMKPVELAERWGVHVFTLANWRVSGNGPRYVKIMGKILYPIYEIEKFERMNTKRSTSDEGVRL